MGSGRKRILLASGVLLAATSIAFATKPQTFTGIVGDAACGAKHDMEGDAASCLRSCVRKGSKYDLVVGEKVYILNIKDDSISDALDRLAGQHASVKGEATGNTIEVTSVSAAK